MKNLRIKLISKKTIIYDIDAFWGLIKLENFTEKLYIPVNYWSIEDYKKQWKDGLKKIKTEDSSCLITTVQANENIINLINLWLLYKQDDQIIVNNQMLFGKNLKNKLDNNILNIDNCYKLIPKFENNLKISRWYVRLNPTYLI